MYGKIFASIYQGTLHGQWQAIVTFQQLIVLCDADGVIDMTPPAIAATTSIPLDIIEKGLKVLANPDPYSRTPGDEGRRIVLLDDHRPWGWRIVNHRYYRDLVSKEDKREKDRQRISEKRAAAKNQVRASKSLISGDVAKCRKVSQVVADVAHTDTDTDTNTDTKTPPTPPLRGEDPPGELENFELVEPKPPTAQEKRRRKLGAPECPYGAIAKLYNEKCHMLIAVRTLSEKRKRDLRAMWKKTPDLDEFSNYFDYIATEAIFLHGDNDREWVADFDFVINDTKIAKIKEGKYNTSGRKRGGR